MKDSLLKLIRLQASNRRLDTFAQRIAEARESNNAEITSLLAGLPEELPIVYESDAGSFLICRDHYNQIMIEPLKEIVKL